MFRRVFCWTILAGTLAVGPLALMPGFAQEPGGDGSSGVQGTVLLEQRPPSGRGRPTYVPVAGAVIDFAPLGTSRVALRVQADEEGNFAAPLAPGTYRVVGEPLADNPRYRTSGWQVVRVRPGEVKTMYVLYTATNG